MSLHFRNEQGFTLIELLIVIAMLTILTTMALPSLQDRVIRTQVHEALGLADFVQNDIQEFYSARKRMPKNNAEAGLPAPEKIVGNYVTSVTVDNGRIVIELGGRINANAAGKQLVVRPAIVDGAPKVPIAWVYGYASTPPKMKVLGENSTTVEPRFLPVNCRY